MNTQIANTQPRLYSWVYPTKMSRIPNPDYIVGYTRLKCLEYPATLYTQLQNDVISLDTCMTTIVSEGNKVIFVRLKIQSKGNIRLITHYIKLKHTSDLPDEVQLFRRVVVINKVFRPSLTNFPFLCHYIGTWDGL